MKRSFIGIAVLAALSTLTACNSNEKRGEKGEKDNEVAVAMNDVPAAVMATLQRESKGGKITEVEKEVKNGRTVYSADIMVDNVPWDITVAEDGSVISKEKEKANEK